MLDKVARRLVEPLIAILLMAAALSGATGDWASFIIIIVILAPRSASTWCRSRRPRSRQTRSSDRSPSRRTVRRDGHIVDVLGARSIVPGDVVELQRRRSRAGRRHRARQPERARQRIASDRRSLPGREAAGAVRDAARPPRRLTRCSAGRLSSAARPPCWWSRRAAQPGSAPLRLRSPQQRARRPPSSAVSCARPAHPAADRLSGPVRAADAACRHRPSSRSSCSRWRWPSASRPSCCRW